MQRFAKVRYCLFPLLALAATAMARNAIAHGEVGEHVNNLKAHLEEYAGEVDWLLEKADGIVQSYAADGAKAAQPGKLIDHWEAVKFHAAIEVTYVPVYATIWQGIYGIKQAIDEGKPVAAVKEQQAIFEKALWQALGAVKLAAQQQDGPQVAHDEHQDAGPTATLEQIGHRLDEVLATYAEQKVDDAKSLVHATYLNRFEGVEGVLIEQDAALVEDLEKDFNVTLPKALDERAPVDNIRQIVKTMQSKLDKAKTLLAEAERDRKDVF